MARKSGRCLRIAVLTWPSPPPACARRAERVELRADGLEVGLAAAACRCLDWTRASRSRAAAGRGLRRRRTVDVRQLLRVAGHVGLVRRPLARVGRPVAERRLDEVAEQLAEARRVRAQRDRLRAAAGLEAHVHAVAVEVLALARDPDERVEELLVVLLAVGELVLDRRGRPRAARRRAGTWRRGRSRAAARSRGRSAAPGRPWRARAPRPARRAPPGRPARASARSTGTPPRSSPASRARPAGSRSRTRGSTGTPRSASRTRCWRCAASAPARGSTRAGWPTRDANAAVVTLKLVIRSLSWFS